MTEPQSQEKLVYELLLRKSSDESENDTPLSRTTSVGGVSTAASTTDFNFDSLSVAESSPTAAPAPEKNSTFFLRAVSVNGPYEDPRVAELVKKTRQLSEHVFDEDCLKDITKKSHWKLTLLVSDDLTVLCGFLVSRIINGALSIAKLAVPEEFRGKGYGKLIMNDACKVAKQQGNIYEVALSSLSTAVTFYQRLGFKAFTGLKIQTEKEVVEGQVYMEKKLRPRPKKKNA